MFRRFFSGKNPKEDFQAIDQALVKLGYLWIDQEPRDLKTDPYLMIWLRAFGDRGQRQENLYALLDRQVPTKRFALHNTHNHWNLDLWYGTLYHGFPPNLRDEDGVEFFRHDVVKHALITVRIRGEDIKQLTKNPNNYSLIYQDSSLNLFPSVHGEIEFEQLSPMLQTLKDLEDRIANIE